MIAVGKEGSASSHAVCGGEETESRVDRIVVIKIDRRIETELPGQENRVEGKCNLGESPCVQSRVNENKNLGVEIQRLDEASPLHDVRGVTEYM
jgi:hypothetical protein